MLDAASRLSEPEADDVVRMDDSSDSDPPVEASAIPPVLFEILPRDELMMESTTSEDEPLQLRFVDGGKPVTVRSEGAGGRRTDVASQSSAAQTLGRNVTGAIAQAELYPPPTTATVAGLVPNSVVSGVSSEEGSSLHVSGHHSFGHVSTITDSTLVTILDQLVEDGSRKKAVTKDWPNTRKCWQDAKNALTGSNANTEEDLAVVTDDAATGESDVIRKGNDVTTCDNNVTTGRNDVTKRECGTTAEGNNMTTLESDVIMSEVEIENNAEFTEAPIAFDEEKLTQTLETLFCDPHMSDEVRERLQNGSCIIDLSQQMSSKLGGIRVRPATSDHGLMVADLNIQIISEDQSRISC